MTEAYEECHGHEWTQVAWLVRVRAQVMCRDEGTGGWVALGGGGLANVMVGKRRRVHRHSGGDSDDSVPRPTPPNYEYFIYGVRITDDTEVLSCTIKKDFQYNKVMPTFHHWVTDEKRFGLTFQTAADARAFDRGVRTAIEELLDGLGGAWPSLHAYKKLNPAPRDDDEENNIFECLNLPSESRSSSENSSASRAHEAGVSQTPILSAITLPGARRPHTPREPRSPRSADTSLKQYGMSGDDEKSGIEESNPDHCPYVHLSAVHEYAYPSVTSGVVISSEKSSPNTKPPEPASLIKRTTICSYTPPTHGLSKKAAKADPFQARLKCRHCHEWYIESANRAGACEFAPDSCRTCVDAASCIKCAQCMLYHCMADSEGDFAMHPCTCGPPDEACAKRWLGIALLSILVPCLWCYAPLRCAHRAARAAHLAGGHHAPPDSHA